MITEKELMLNLLVDERDFDRFLDALGEGSKKGNLAFKKMKVRKLFQKKMSPEILKKFFVLTQYQESTLEAILGEFLGEKEDIPYLAQYLTLKEFYPDFIEEHLAQICENIEAQRYFLAEIDCFNTIEAIEKFYLSKYEDSKSSYLDQTILDSTVWYEENICNLFELKNQFKGMDLKDFYHRSQTYEANAENIEFATDWQSLNLAPERLQQLIQMLNEVELLHIFVSVGNLEEHMRKNFLVELLKRSMLFSTEYEEMQKIIQTELLKAQLEESERTIQTLQKEVKQVQRSTQQINQKCEQLNEQLSLKEQVIGQLNNELSYYKKLSAGYDWGLRTGYEQYQMAVICESQLLYATHVFPDIKFISLEQLNISALNYKYLIVQQYGLTYKQKQLIEEKAKLNNSILIMLTSRDERELIVDLSTILKNLEEDEQ